MKKFLASAIALFTLAASQASAVVAVDNGKIVTGNAAAVIELDPNLLIVPEDSAGYKNTVVAVRELQGFELGSLALSAKYWPRISILCDGVEVDSATGIVLQPIKVLRLVAYADVTACKAVTIQKPSDVEAMKATSATISWYFMGGYSTSGH